MRARYLIGQGAPPARGGSTGRLPRRISPSSQSLLRQKLNLVLAILETIPDNARAFLPASRPRAAVLLKPITAGILILPVEPSDLDRGHRTWSSGLLVVDFDPVCHIHA